ncbi:hypothetical protein HDV06_007012 [Boothiomyces sp. JEL0866]|nr:hypothetical protein HDV06_007012 [Boothiomyces sp. JEL0866]
MSEGLSRLQQVLGNQKQEQPKFAIQTQIKPDQVTYSPKTLNTPIRHSPLVKEILIEEDDQPRFAIVEEKAELKEEQDSLPRFVVDSKQESATTLTEAKEKPTSKEKDIKVESKEKDIKVESKEKDIKVESKEKDIKVESKEKDIEVESKETPIPQVSVDTEMDNLPRFKVNEPLLPPETEINAEAKKNVNIYSAAAVNALYESQNYDPPEEAVRVSTVKSENTVSTLNTIHSSDKDASNDKEPEVETLPRFVIPSTESNSAPSQTPKPPVLVNPSSTTTTPSIPVSTTNTHIVTASNTAVPSASPNGTSSHPSMGAPVYSNSFTSVVSNSPSNVLGIQSGSPTISTSSFTYSPGQFSQANRFSSTSFNIPPPPSDTQSELDLSDIELETEDYAQRKKELEQKLLDFMAIGKPETQLGKRIAKSLKRRNVTVHSELDEFEIGAALKEYEVQRKDTHVTASAQALEALKQSLIMSVPSKMNGPPIPPLPTVKTILEQRELQYQQYARYTPSPTHVQPQVQQYQMNGQYQPQMNPQPQFQQIVPTERKQTCPNCKRMTSITSKATGFCCFKKSVAQCPECQFVLE